MPKHSGELLNHEKLVNLIKLDELTALYAAQLYRYIEGATGVPSPDINNISDAFKKVATEVANRNPRKSPIHEQIKEDLTEIHESNTDFVNLDSLAFLPQGLLKYEILISLIEADEIIALWAGQIYRLVEEGTKENNPSDAQIKESFGKCVMGMMVRKIGINLAGQFLDVDIMAMQKLKHKDGEKKYFVTPPTIKETEFHIQSLLSYKNIVG